MLYEWDGRTYRVERGLDGQSVQKSREKHGANAFVRKKSTPVWKQFLANFGDPIIQILLVVLCINVLFALHGAGWFETLGIAAAVLVSTLVSTISEHGSESAFEQLMEEAERITCRVRREGQVQEIPVSEVVAGDLVLLQAGERVPADGCLLQGELRADQSALNGEGKEVRKIAGGQKEEVWDLSAQNQLFKGSVITQGEGILLVYRVGGATFYGQMAGELQTEVRDSPLKVKLRHLAGSLSRMGYLAAVLIALADLFHALVMENGFVPSLIWQEVCNPQAMLVHLIHALTLAITIVVVAVPEGLPMMITVVLSSNVMRMLRDQVMVRRLVGIETAGGIHILFTDKTGTLTRGQLSVEHLVDGTGQCYDSREALHRQAGLWKLVQGCCKYNTDSTESRGQPVGGNATDRALMAYALPFDQDEVWSVIQRQPFDSARKYAAVQLERRGEKLVFVKGAPEKLLHACTAYFDQQGKRKILQDRGILERKWREMTRQSQRVLILATAPHMIHEDCDIGDLCLIALVGIRDQLRPEVRGAVREVQQAGVQVVMVTGDNRDTAAAIAQDAGLLHGCSAEAVVTSSDLAAMDEEQLRRRLPSLRVVARALPTDKSRLVAAAQQQGMVVAMTGDGINDAPALRRADVGFAMGSGTEVAKEAGDIVILDDNFASIVRAVWYGRTIFRSIQRFIVFQMTMNLCAVGLSLIGPFIGVDTPITVIQMLWCNLIMDTLAGLAFAGEPPRREYMQRPPVERTEPVLNRSMVQEIVQMGGAITLICVALLKWQPLQQFFDGAALLTALFGVFIFANVCNSLNVRTPRLDVVRDLRRNPLFLGIMAMVAAIQLLLLYCGGSLFRTVALDGWQLCLVFFLSILVFPIAAVRKMWMRMIRPKNGSSRPIRRSFSQSV